MHLEKIQLQNFKNYKDFEVQFSPQLNCIVGKNGSGKTNLLDSIHFLGLTKSAVTTSDRLLMLENKPFYSVIGHFNKAEKNHLVSLVYSSKDGKKIALNKKVYEKKSDHIGKFPVVIILPNDTDLIREGSEFRRKFFDNLLCQTNPKYLSDLVNYKNLIKSRNALLKQFSERRYIDRELLASYDDRILDLNSSIYDARKQMEKDLVNPFLEYHAYLTESKENVSVEHRSEVGELNFNQIYREALEDDIYLQRTTKGIHKDDFVFKINNKSLKNYGSQGQQKSFVIALQLAKYNYLKSILDIKPLLLLDDIFDKLDNDRIQKLINLVARGEFGQVFISDANPERLNSYIEILKQEVKIIHLEAGEIVIADELEEEK